MKKVLTDKQYELMKMLLTCTQDNLKKVLAQYLKEKYKKVKITNDYIIAYGNIPVALAAHMDTVFEDEIASLKTKYGELLYDKEKNIMHCVGFGGFDDKAGVFAILQIIQAGLRPHIILSTDEERGCVGATVLSKEKCPFKDLRYIIQLDRRGSKDCVFYDMDTEDPLGKQFLDYIESFGFSEAYGTFTDITEYCPAWGIAGVNLSVGYFNEHTNCEVLYVDILMATIKKVMAMLRQTEIPTFPYIESPYIYNWKNAYGWSWDSQTGKSQSGPGPAKAAVKYMCSCCNKGGFVESEMFPVVGIDDSTKFFCADCLAGNVNWCVKCYEAYEYDPSCEEEDLNYVCPYCKKLKGNP